MLINITDTISGSPPFPELSKILVAVLSCTILILFPTAVNICRKFLTCSAENKKKSVKLNSVFLLVDNTDFDLVL